MEEAEGEVIDEKTGEVLPAVAPAERLAVSLWDREQIDLLKRTIAKGATDDEFALFMHIVKRTGLDPFAKQIYFSKRWDSKTRKEAMVPMTGIDGYRLIAERSKRYSPGREPSYTYDEQHRLISATAHIKKQTEDGTWHEISATAVYREYVQTGQDGKPFASWSRMPHVMLAKCAESLAIRRAFPAELSGVYTDDEMQQGETSATEEPRAALPAAKKEPPKKTMAGAEPKETNHVPPYVRPQPEPEETAHATYEVEQDMAPTTGQLELLRKHCDKLMIPYRRHTVDGVDTVEVWFPSEVFVGWETVIPPKAERWRTVYKGNKELPDITAKRLDEALALMNAGKVEVCVEYKGAEVEGVPF